MSENVSPEEIEALVGDDPTTAPQEAVELRDFSQPKRLSPAQQQGIVASVKRALPTIEGELAHWIGGAYSITLAGIGESSSVGLFDGLEDPLATLTVDVEGSQGWVVWDRESALRAVLSSLGSEIGEDEEFEVRALSPIEGGLAGDILAVFAKRVGELFDLVVHPECFSQNVRDFLGHYSADPSGDTQRLFLHFDLEGEGLSSTVRLYLPSILPKAQSASNNGAPKLPTHLDEVPVRMSAELGCAEVSLAELMKIEVGDVIPLNSFVNAPIDVLIEGSKAGKAQWGSFNGCLALSIETLDSTVRPNPSSTEDPGHE